MFASPFLKQMTVTCFQKVNCNPVPFSLLIMQQNASIPLEKLFLSSWVKSLYSGVYSQLEDQGLSSQSAPKQGQKRVNESSVKGKEVPIPDAASLKVK